MKKSTKSFTDSRIFVDTGGFYSLLVRGDEHHSRANELFQKAVRKRSRFLTTDYVLSEAATLLSARGHRHLIEILFESIFGSNACNVEWMDPVRFNEVREFLQRHQDKSWSFTDCFSYCVMHQFKLRRALTNDHHFRQAGFEPLLA